MDGTVPISELIPLPITKNGTKQMANKKKEVQEIIELGRKWIRATYGQFMVDDLKEQAKQMDGRQNDFLIVPTGKEVKIHLQKRICSVKYTLNFVRHTVDHARKLQVIAME